MQMAAQLLVLVWALLSLRTATGFSVWLGGSSMMNAPSASGSSSFRRNSIHSRLLARSANLEDDDEEEKDELEELIIKEKFYRELMRLDEDKKKKPKGKQKSIKKPHDNRDQLAFLVQVMTPPEDIYEQEVLKQQKKKKSKKKRKKGGGNDEEDNGVVGETLGEFQFEKNTSSGDRIEIDQQVYVVTKAKCQYRYAGAQKFVMVRKILQVKPVQRAMQEEYILRQFNAPSARESE